MRVVTLLICLGLAGCAATSEPGGQTTLTSVMAPQASAPPPAVAPQATAAPPTALPPAPQPTPAHIPAAGPPSRSAVATRPPEPPPPEPKAEPELPMTHERASSLCWMKYEDGRKKLTLDQRADLVDKCVKATMATGQKPSDEPAPRRAKRR